MLLQALLVLVKKVPQKEGKLLIIGTSSAGDLLSELEIGRAFDIRVNIPELTKKDDIEVKL